MAQLINDRLDVLDDLRNLDDDNDSLDTMDDLRELADDETNTLEKVTPVAKQPTIDEPVDDLRELADDETDTLEKVAVTVSSPKIDAPVKDSLDDLRKPATESDNDDAPVAEEKPVVAVATKVETPAKTEMNTPVVDKVETPPAPKATADKVETPPAPKATVTTTNDEAIAGQTLALRAFLFLREVFIRTVEIVLTGIAIILEFIVALPWKKTAGTVLIPFKAIHQHLPSKYRIPVYAIIALLCFGLPSIYGAFALLSGGTAFGSVVRAQTISVSQGNPVAVNQDIIAPLFSATVQQWAVEIEGWTSGTDITPHMLAVVMQLQSCGNPSVLGGLFGMRADGVVSNPDAEADLAIQRLQNTLAMSEGNLALALAIYADGERVLSDDFGLWTLHARDMFIIGRNLYQEAEAGYPASSDLNSWLQNTGSILCTTSQTALNG